MRTLGRSGRAGSRSSRTPWRWVLDYRRLGCVLQTANALYCGCSRRGSRCGQHTCLNGSSGSLCCRSPASWPNCAWTMRAWWRVRAATAQIIAACCRFGCNRCLLPGVALQAAAAAGNCCDRCLLLVLLRSLSDAGTLVHIAAACVEDATVPPHRCTGLLLDINCCCCIDSSTALTAPTVLQACCTTRLRTAATWWGWTKSTSTLGRRCGASWRARPSSGAARGFRAFSANRHAPMWLGWLPWLPLLLGAAVACFGACRLAWLAHISMWQRTSCLG